MFPHNTATVAQIGEFDEVIDVRAPAEYAEDHLPGAISAPVLSDAERERVGTLYMQASPFEAKKVGAALVAINIARHLQEKFHDRPKGWRPLIYCWRGGMRSGSMVEIFSRVGWPVAQLSGGYKAYRRHVIDQLAHLPGKLDLRIVCGPTGSGKSRLLRTLAGIGVQVLDLEALACHRGSVLGHLPDEPQPAQKLFESRLWHAMQGYAPGAPVFVEAESKKVGGLHVPDALMQRMRAAPCLRVELADPARVALLKEEYAHFLADPARLNQQLDILVALHGRARVAEWKALSDAGDWDVLVGRLLTEHYDPAYLRGMARNFSCYEGAPAVAIDGIDEAAFERAARQAMETAAAAAHRPEASA
ncbi:MAG: tRNA 2-selenouridine(34) synthase MnmH [Betaproteobacteria bacterium]|nr:tRNA 2-selenouridine(34) synthase MnmH [Betaproteobacteria bacterium]